MISFIVYGEPVAQGRPRFTTVNGHAKAYDPEKSYSYKQLVRLEAIKVKPETPLTGALSINVIAFRSIPKAFSNKKRILAIEGHLRPITKPDIDNIVKGIKDALKGVIWRDDSQVVSIYATKYYSESPRVEIEVLMAKGCE